MLFEISKSFFHTGEDFDFGNNVIVKHPKIRDIIGINQGVFCDIIYMTYLSILLSDPYDNMVFLDDRGIDYEMQTPFDVFCLRWEESDDKGPIQESMAFFLGDHDFNLQKLPSGEWVVYDANDLSYVFGREVFDGIVAFITGINCLERTDKIIPANATAKRILIEDMRDEMKRAARRKPKKKHEDVIAAMISAAVYGGTGAVTPFNFMDLGIFQLNCAANVARKKQRVGSMLNGIYTGMLKADKLPEEDLRWY